MICFRTACTTGLEANYFNTSTREWYCRECAAQINFWSERDHETTLCIRRDLLEREDQINPVVTEVL